MATIGSNTQLQKKAGAGRSSTPTSTEEEQWREEAEAFLNAATRFNWVDEYSNLNTDVQQLLDQIVNDLAAMYYINFDTTGYASLEEAQQMINTLWIRAKTSIEILRDQKVEEFVRNA